MTGSVLGIEMSYHLRRYLGLNLNETADGDFSAMSDDSPLDADASRKCTLEEVFVDSDNDEIV